MHRVLAPVLFATFALSAPTSSRAATPLATELVAAGFADPLLAIHAPGDRDRLFVVEQRGTIRIVDVASDPPALGATFLDIQSLVSFTSNERGLLGLAFHPGYATNGNFYVTYTGLDFATKLSRFSVSAGDPDDADEGTETILLSIAQPQGNHNGGWVAFGPDGYLYMGSGDGGGVNGDSDAGHTPGLGNAQDITDNLLGKILRIDIDGNDGPGGLYGIPPDNPFVGVTGDDEIWAYGLRNPWRNTFDRANGDLYIADVGQHDWEEIDYQSASSGGGESYGWRCREGAHDFNFAGTCGSITHVEPIAEYDHGGLPARCSITGGEVYRGCAIPDLRGTYFYADYCSNQIFSLVVQGGVATSQLERTTELDPPGAATITKVTSFGTDVDGELYIVDRGGEVFKIVPDGPAAPCPTPLPASRDGAQLLLAVALFAATRYAIPRRR